MIHVENLTKYFGDYPAVRDVSFDVDRGQIVGFLGPNGAGKSTTMRILAGFITATSGTASIDGVDVFWKPIDARRKIGYLPENCPLYTEMKVNEYLRFRGGLKGLGRSDRRKRMEYVIESCWLNDVRHQLIGTLSKGYRQRVGLADALIADPPVLILDEPTAGLDPTQIRETRKLIRELGKQHTMLLSTHILPEVEMTCDSVIIIHQGKVAAEGSLSSFSQRYGGQSLEEIFVRITGDEDGLPTPMTEAKDPDLIRKQVVGFLKYFLNKVRSLSFKAMSKKSSATDKMERKVTYDWLQDHLKLSSVRELMPEWSTSQIGVDDLIDAFRHAKPVTEKIVDRMIQVEEVSDTPEDVASWSRFFTKLIEKTGSELNRLAPSLESGDADAQGEIFGLGLFVGLKHAVPELKPAGKDEG